MKEMTHPNLIPNASIYAITGNLMSNLMQVAFITQGGEKRIAFIEQRPGAAMQDECRAQMAQDASHPPVLDLLLTSYGTVATFAAPGELDEVTAQAILDYVG